MQSLFAISSHDFRAQVRAVRLGNIKNLLRGIYDLKWTKREKMPDIMMIDLERKETIIVAELIRRGVVQKNNYAEYERFIKGLFKKRYY